MKQKIYYYQILKAVKRVLNKLIEKQKKFWISKSTNQDKHFFSIQINIWRFLDDRLIVSRDIYFNY